MEKVKLFLTWGLILYLRCFILCIRESILVEDQSIGKFLIQLNLLVS